MQARFGEELIDQTARVAAALAQDQRFARKRECTDDALMRMLVLRAGNCDQLIFKQQLCLDAARLDRQRDEREIKFARENLFDQRLARAGRNGYFSLRVALV